MEHVKEQLINKVAENFYYIWNENMPIPKITNTATDEQCDLYDRILEKVDEKNKDEVSDLLFDYCDINTLNGFNGGFKYALALAGVLPSGQGENHD